MTDKRKPELLAPAGNMEALIAAVENGADAVYLGGQVLNARRGAGNFDKDELIRATEYCHERGRRVYITVNTMVKQRELDSLSEIAAQMAAAGADAAIVQDFGVAKALSLMLPSLKIHASTQMAVTNRQGVEYAKNCGFDRVVLARELTFAEIRDCAQTGMELEVFVHGALCVASSGQCLFSSLVGGRSGNRGMCAQPCRLPYRMTCGDKRYDGYLLSPKDLNSLNDLDALACAGAASLKIEGRLKRPEYVAIVTDIYRRALDGESRPEDLRALSQIFNRGGFTRGYAPGLIDADFISQARPNHAGVRVGTVKNGLARLEENILPGDALAVRADDAEDAPVQLSGRAGDAVRVPFVRGGELIRLTSEAQLAAARESYRETKPSIPVRAALTARVGEQVKLTVTDGAREVSATGETVPPATGRGADVDRIRAQLSKMGATPYFLKDAEISVQENAFLAVSQLNALRRDALTALARMRIQSMRNIPAAPLDAPVPAPVVFPPARAKIIAQGENAETLIAARDAGADEICFFPRDVRGDALTDASRALHDFYLAVPQTLDAGALTALNDWALRKDEIKGVYLSNAAHFAMEWPGEIKADYALNIANTFALSQLGESVKAFTPSLELTAGEIQDIGGNAELIVYGRIPLMQLRHCPLNARLGCGPHAACRRCDDGNAEITLAQTSLTDRRGVVFPLSRVAAQGGCVVRVMNSVPMMLLRKMERLPRASAYRLLFTDEPETRVRALTRQFALYAGGNDYQTDPDWGITNGEETTTGHYFRGVE